MKAILASIALAAASLPALAGIAIVPQPASVVARPGAFRLTPATTIVVPENDPDAARIADHLARSIGSTHGFRPAVRPGGKPAGAIRLVRDTDPLPNAEGYRLDVNPSGATIRAHTAQGLFYGAMTLWQLAFPVADRRAATIPAVHIHDAPRFAWRGLMLDSARHFQSPAFIKRYLDAMALHKLNVLHWHLTDDQAWRLEIKAYPKLTEIGAWRVPAGDAAKKDIDPATGKPRLYGGFYTQETVKEIVAYARERGILVVPEIEMPGHASAAIAAYPRLASIVNPPETVSADWGVFPNAFSLEEDTFAFLEEVLTEVIALFPGPYLHVGGDEVEKAQWKSSPAGLERMRRLGTSDPAELQTYFTQRIGTFLASRNRRLVGWDEILTPGLPDSAVVMSWRGVDGALTAASKGHDTILAPAPTLYFDNWQAKSPTEPPGRGNVVSLESVYAFEPMPAQIAPDKRKHVLGLQGQVWTEHIRTEDRVSYMTFPRAAAIAELGWSQPERRDYKDFLARLRVQAQRYEALKIPYARTAFAPARAVPALHRKSQDLKLCTESIALNLEDDAPRAEGPKQGQRAAFLVDVQNPCWIYEQADLTGIAAIEASIGQLPFNFQIGEAVKKIAFPAPRTAAGELEVRLGADCRGELIARLPVAAALASDAVTKLPPQAIAARRGRHDLCLRFAQPALEPVWVIDTIRLVPGARRAP